MTQSIQPDFYTIAQNRKNFILRDSQIDLAQEIFDFITTKSIPTDLDVADGPGASQFAIMNAPADGPGSLLLEAGTGTGKSLGYLVPIIRSGKRAIISTGTKALQKQLMGELQDLRKIYPTMSYKVLQGASNYACLLKADGLQNSVIQNFMREQRTSNSAGMVDEFKKNSKIFNKMLWNEIATDSNLCQKKCKHFDQCFYQNARADARSSQIIVLNHDLLLLYYKLNHEILKGVDVVVVDEAHHFPEKARLTLGRAVSNSSLSKFFRTLNWKLKNIHNSSFRIDPTFYEDIEETLFNFFPTDQPMIRLKEMHPELKKEASRLKEKILADATALKNSFGSAEDVHSDYARIKDLAEDVRVLFEETDDNWIKIHRTKQLENATQQRIEAVPLDIGPLLHSFFAKKAVVMTSATLRSGADFEFFKQQIGQISSKTNSYPSPFSRNNVALFVPNDPIDPIQPAYYQNLTNYMLKIHTLMGGRSLFLFTNKEDMDEAKKLIPAEMKDRFYFQSHTADVPHMIKTLKTSDNLSLVGLSTLWEGVDVVGKALSCVCIMRLPFGNPDDVLFSAMKERFKKENQGDDFKFFEKYELPSMLLKLKQGFGRLQRHETDTGLLAVLDNRFLRKSYKNKVIELLENYDCYDNLEEAVSNIPGHTIGRFTKISKLL